MNVDEVKGIVKSNDIVRIKLVKDDPLEIRTFLFMRGCRHALYRITRSDGIKEEGIESQPFKQITNYLKFGFDCVATVMQENDINSQFNIASTIVDKEEQIIISDLVEKLVIRTDVSNVDTVISMLSNDCRYRVKNNVIAVVE